MTKDEAEKKVLEENEKSLGYCPLIKMECKKRCVCYSPALVQQHLSYNYATKVNNTSYSVSSACCNSPLISGYCDVPTNGC